MARVLGMIRLLGLNIVAQVMMNNGVASRAVAVAVAVVVAAAPMTPMTEAAAAFQQRQRHRAPDSNRRRILERPRRRQRQRQRAGALSNPQTEETHSDGTASGKTPIGIKDWALATADGISSLPRRFRRRDRREQATLDGSYDGSDGDGSENIGGSPGQRLMQQYKQSGKQRASPPVTMPFFANSDPSDNENGTFDAIKNAFFVTPADAVDDAAQTKGRELEALRKREGPAVAAVTSSVRDRNLPNTKAAREALPDLESNNPVTRAFATWKIRDAERKERQRVAERERERAFVAFKERMYRVGDAVQWTAGAVGKIPSFLERTVKFLASLPESVQRALEAIRAVPGQLERQAAAVQKKAEEVQESVQGGIESTKQLIEDAKALPDKVQRTAKETQESIESAVETVQQATTNAKVILGLEKAQPKPPNVPPPKPPTVGEIGINVAKTMGNGAVQGAWKLTKGATFFVYSGARMALEWGAQALKEPSETGKGGGAVQETMAVAAPPPLTKKTSDTVSTERAQAQNPPSVQPRPPAVEPPLEKVDVIVQEQRRTNNKLNGKLNGNESGSDKSNSRGNRKNNNKQKERIVPGQKKEQEESWKSEVDDALQLAKDALKAAAASNREMK